MRRPPRRERGRPRRRRPPPCAGRPACAQVCKSGDFRDRRAFRTFSRGIAATLQFLRAGADIPTARISNGVRPMLDAFRNIGGAKGKLVEQQASELEALIATAREERGAISAMLTALTTRSQKLTPLSKSIEQVSERATAVTTRLDEIANRLTAIDDRAREIDAIDKRILALKDAAQQAEHSTQKAIGPDGELQKHREAVQQLSSQALQ